MLGRINRPAAVAGPNSEDGGMIFLWCVCTRPGRAKPGPIPPAADFPSIAAAGLPNKKSTPSRIGLYRKLCVGLEKERRWYGE